MCISTDRRGANAAGVRRFDWWQTVSRACLELVLPVAEALVQSLQLCVRVHASSSSLLLLHLPNERQVIIKQAPLAVKLFLHTHVQFDIFLAYTFYSMPHAVLLAMASLDPGGSSLVFVKLARRFVMQYVCCCRLLIENLPSSRLPDSGLGVACKHGFDSPRASQHG